MPSWQHSETVNWAINKFHFRQWVSSMLESMEPNLVPVEWPVLSKKESTGESGFGVWHWRRSTCPKIHITWETTWDKSSADCVWHSTAMKATIWHTLKCGTSSFWLEGEMEIGLGKETSTESGKASSKRGCREANDADGTETCPAEENRCQQLASEFWGRLILVKIGRPGYRVTKQFNPETCQRSLLFQVMISVPSIRD